jgi:molybdenum cofactor cytidylyltransferase
MRMGAGGLLKEISSRPQPRDPKEGSEMPKARTIAAVILAAGQSHRMGRANKLLADMDGVPMVRRVTEAVLKSRASPVYVVTGHENAAVEQALSGLAVTAVPNPHYADGLSTSVKAGLSVLSGTSVDGALICLGDMPLVSSGILDRLIAAFDPDEGRSICVPTSHGKRGNPVLWSARFFPEMMQVSGDMGAKALIAENEESVCEVDVSDDAIFTDIDTPEALDAVTRRS